MKVEIKRGQETTKTKFPALYQSKQSRLVVLFTSASKGFKVRDVIGNFCISNTEDWVNCDHASHWERLPDGTQLILTQG